MFAPGRYRYRRPVQPERQKCSHRSVHTGDNIIFSRTQQNLLQESSAITSLMTISLPVFGFLTFATGRRRSVHRQTLHAPAGSPVFKRAFGEFHDVAFVHQGHKSRSLAIAYSIAARTRRLVPLQNTA